MKRKSVLIFIAFLCITLLSGIQDVKAFSAKCVYSDFTFTIDGDNINVVSNKNASAEVKNELPISEFKDGDKYKCPDNVKYKLDASSGTAVYTFASSGSLSLSLNTSESEIPELTTPNGGGTGGPLSTIRCGSIENMPEALPNITRTLVNLIKIITPILMIIFGMLDFTKAVISNDDKVIAGSKTKFIQRLVAGAVVFLVITIVQFVLGVIAVDDHDNIIKCIDCLVSDSSKCG